MRQPTIRDVAKKAGLSKSLVSLVMNDSPRVSDKSRIAVLTAASELGYRRNAAARSLVSRQSQLIGVVISSAYEMFHNEALDGVKQQVGSAHYTAFVQWGRRERTIERKAIEAFLEVRVDALILLGNDLAATEQGADRTTGTWKVVCTTVIAPSTDQRPSRNTVTIGDEQQSSPVVAPSCGRS